MELESFSRLLLAHSLVLEFVDESGRDHAVSLRQDLGFLIDSYRNFSPIPSCTKAASSSGAQILIHRVHQLRVSGAPTQTQLPGLINRAL